MLTTGLGVQGIPDKLDGVSTSVRVRGQFAALPRGGNGGGGNGGGGKNKNKAPSITIDSVSAVGDLATLVATATDVEDDASGTALSVTWVSSLDGDIGTGAILVVTLSDDADHNITATATDSGGKSDSDSASLTIGNPPPPPAPFDRTAKHRPIPIGISRVTRI